MAACAFGFKLIHPFLFIGALEKLRLLLRVNYMPAIIFPSVSKDISGGFVPGREVERPALECRLL